MSTPESAARSRESDLLDSWKTIAAYLGRSVRTVQGWEKNERLPVHRQHHEKQGSVYAYISELDAWIESRRSSTKAEEEPAASVKHAKIRWAAAVAGVLMLSVMLWWLGRDSRQLKGAAIASDPPHPILIAAVENRTRDPLFDGTIEYLLDREISESTRLNVVSQQRLADVLRLMKRTADTRVDRTLAPEIAARDGGIRAIIAPRVEKLGSRYVVGVDLLDAMGSRVAAYTEYAATYDEIAFATRKLAARVRHTLGERTATASAVGQPLQKVTSSSLRAVQLFTRADRLIAFHSDAAAERLLLQSIDEDPAFASAHMHLAFAKRNQRKPPATYLRDSKRAVELAGSSSDRERYFINGGHASLTGKYDEAIAHYRALLEIEPDHLWANSNLSDILRSQGRWEEAVPYRVRIAQLRPTLFIANFTAGESLAMWGGKRDEGRRYFSRATELITSDDEDQWPMQVVWARLYPAHDAWLKNDHQTLSRELDTWTAKARSMRTAAADALLQNMGYYELEAGRQTRAEQIIELIRDPVERRRYQATLAFVGGQREVARAMFEKLVADQAELSAVELLRAVQSGTDTSTVQQALGRVHIVPADRAIISAEIALNEKNERRLAVERYRDALHAYGRVGARGLPLYLAGVDSVAKALADEGRVAEAMALMDEARRHRGRVFSDSVPSWSLLEARLLQLARIAR